LGFTQITRTTRLRWITLHLSQIFLTDARTFIIENQKSGDSSQNKYQFFFSFRLLISGS
jgi:hypothetical protein